MNLFSRSFLSRLVRDQRRILELDPEANLSVAAVEEILHRRTVMRELTRSQEAELHRLSDDLKAEFVLEIELILGKTAEEIYAELLAIDQDDVREASVRSGGTSAVRYWNRHR
jgi:hypothetical protein